MSESCLVVCGGRGGGETNPCVIGHNSTDVMLGLVSGLWDVHQTACEGVLIG